MEREHMSRRPVGVYTTGDFGPLVRKFEQTPTGSYVDDEGRMRLDGLSEGYEDGPDVADYMVNEHIRSAIKDFGAEEPMAESDQPRDRTGRAVQSSWKLRRWTGAGYDAPDHSELNLSHMGPDPRGTALNPDRAGMREWSERRAGYLERTMGGQDSAAQDVGDERPSEWDETMRRRLATDMLRTRKKVFSTSYGSYMPPGVAPHEKRSQAAASSRDLAYGSGAGHDELIAETLVAPRETTWLGYRQSALGPYGPVAGHDFAVAQYGENKEGFAPGLVRPSDLVYAQTQNEFHLAQEARTQASLAVANAFRAGAEAAGMGAIETDALATARMALMTSGTNAHLGRPKNSGGAATAATRTDASFGTHTQAATRTTGHVDLAAGYAAASGGGAGRRVVSDGDRGVQDRLAASFALARISGAPLPKDASALRAKMTALLPGELMVAPSAESRAAPKAATPHDPSKAASMAAANARYSQDLAVARATANYSSAPPAEATSLPAKTRADRMSFARSQGSMKRAAAPLPTDGTGAARDAVRVHAGTFANFRAGDHTGRARKPSSRRGRMSRVAAASRGITESSRARFGHAESRAVSA